MANPFRNAMAYLGLVEEDQQQGEFHEEAYTAPQPVKAQPQATKAPVTPIRKAQVRPVVQHGEMNEILTVHPRQYSDARIIAENFRDGVPVIINLSQMSENDARRLVDFASGLSQGLYGKIERVTAKVFLLSPAHVAVTGENDDVAEEDSTFFDQD